MLHQVQERVPCVRPLGQGNPFQLSDGPGCHFGNGAWASADDVVSVSTPRTVAERQLGVHVDGVSRAGLSTMVKRSFESITVSTFINS